MRFEQLETPPVGKHFRVKVTLRTGEDGKLHNEVRDVEALETGGAGGAVSTGTAPRGTGREEAEAPASGAGTASASGTDGPRAEVPAHLLED